MPMLKTNSYPNASANASSKDEELGHHRREPWCRARPSLSRERGKDNGQWRDWTGGVSLEKKFEKSGWDAMAGAC